MIGNAGRLPNVWLLLLDHFLMVSGQMLQVPAYVLEPIWPSRDDELGCSVLASPRRVFVREGEGQMIERATKVVNDIANIQAPTEWVGFRYRLYDEVKFGRFWITFFPNNHAWTFAGCDQLASHCRRGVMNKVVV